MSGLNEATRDLLRQIRPEVPRHAPYGALWLYEQAPHTRGYEPGVRVECLDSDTEAGVPEGREGVVVGARLIGTTTLILQIQWDGLDYAPGRCSYALDAQVGKTGQPTTAARTSIGQLALFTAGGSAAA